MASNDQLTQLVLDGTLTLESYWKAVVNAVKRVLEDWPR